MASKTFLTLSILTLLLSAQVTQTYAGPAACLACVSAHVSEAAAICTISGPGYVMCLLGLCGIKGAIMCTLICMSPTP